MPGNLARISRRYQVSLQFLSQTGICYLSDLTMVKASHLPLRQV